MVQACWLQHQCAPAAGLVSELHELTDALLLCTPGHGHPLQGPAAVPVPVWQGALRPPQHHHWGAEMGTPCAITAHSSLGPAAAAVAPMTA